MSSVLLDTNVYCDSAYLEMVRKIRSQVHSSVVVQELLVITNQAEQPALIRSFRESLDAGRGFVPDHVDWIEVGKCLHRLHQRGISDFGKLAKSEVNMLVRDALIARTAIRAKALLITHNTSDFSKIQAVFGSLKFRSPADFFGMRPR